eukprot:scaffold4049_cov204-Alexandrium_tamarense.AAC.20
MLNQLERASKNAQQRKGPERFGPMTRGEWEKMRNRWEKDDLLRWQEVLIKDEEFASVRSDMRNKINELRLTLLEIIEPSQID